VWDENAPVQVVRKDAGAFELRLASGSVAGGPSATALYALTNWSPVGFTAEFTPAAGRGLVVYFSPHQARLAGRLEMAAVPFGFIDIPKEAVTCNGRDADLQGWALDEGGIDRIVVAIESSNGAAGKLVEIGVAQRVARPDVAAVYPGYPDSQSAGWTYKVPCGVVTNQVSANGARIHVIARNRGGATGTLGIKPLQIVK
jgi:hypothetical protein